MIVLVLHAPGACIDLGVSNLVVSMMRIRISINVIIVFSISICTSISISISVSRARRVHRFMELGLVRSLVVWLVG